MADTRVLVALGSNEGDSRVLLAAAIASLAGRAAAEFRVSALYRTAPVDCPAGARDFINAAVAFVAQPGETPESLLDFLQSLEAAAGRPGLRPRNAPRPLDADLILFGGETRCDQRLELPHPRALQRRFVLQPAADVAATLRWPGSTSTVAELLAQLPPDRSMKRL